jgi:hypothetical protein
VSQSELPWEAKCELEVEAINCSRHRASNICSVQEERGNALLGLNKEKHGAIAVLAAPGEEPGQPVGGTETRYMFASVGSTQAHVFALGGQDCSLSVVIFGIV